MMTGTHRMDRRCVHHHYSWPGMYHVTVKVNDAFRQPLGRIVGDIGKADGEADAPRVELSDAGRMVEQELTTSITALYPQGYKVPSNGTTGREPLFSYGYVDVMPIDERQLEQQRQYIRNNPRSRLMRTQNRAWLHTQRLAVPTALSPSALKGYLQKECSPAQINDDAWLRLQDRLLTLNGSVACDSYGNQQLPRR